MYGSILSHANGHLLTQVSAYDYNLDEMVLDLMPRQPHGELTLEGRIPNGIIRGQRHKRDRIERERNSAPQLH